MTQVDYTLTEEQELLRKTARRFLTDRVGSEKVRELMGTDSAHDADLWREAAGMGWHGLAIPEELGGAGYGFAELSIVLEEQGRAVYPGPFLSTVVLGANALLLGGSDEQKKEHLPAIAAGELTAALALLESAHGLTADTVELTVTDGVLNGRKRYVLDGHTADLVIVAARDDTDVNLFLVDGHADGVTRELTSTLDATRKQATLTFENVAAQPMPGGWDVVEQVQRLAAAALACELVGVAQRSLEMALEYARGRYQFGRPIGSFQAIKHRLADMLVRTEHSRSAAYHAARTSDDPDEFPIASALAKAIASETATWVTGEAIQVHGGIGFTWEHDAHLYFKRAKAASLLFGDARHHRALLADALGL
ncbi:MAG: acyl-CoA/acyl-ACP dehydrogenase [Actinobacteria bacterium]|nr:acyl-CoA/acyl-ACP dehydrogenase [Actinomycetota bacterium]